MEGIEKQIETLNRSIAMLHNLRRVDLRGKSPNARELLSLLVCAVSHEKWAWEQVAGLLDTIEDEYRRLPTGGGARGSDHHPILHYPTPNNLTGA